MRLNIQCLLWGQTGFPTWGPQVRFRRVQTWSGRAVRWSSCAILLSPATGRRPVVDVDARQQLCQPSQGVRASQDSYHRDIHRPGSLIGGGDRLDPRILPAELTMRFARGLEAGLERILARRDAAPPQTGAWDFLPVRSLSSARAISAIRRVCTTQSILPGLVLRPRSTISKCSLAARQFWESHPATLELRPKMRPRLRHGS